MQNARRPFVVLGKLVSGAPVRRAPLCLLILGFLAAAPAAALGGQRALVQQGTTLGDQAVAAYHAGDFEKMKKLLPKALALTRHNLDDQQLMARVYLHLGVLNVDGLDNRPAGVKYFARARAVRADVAVPSNMATRTVASAFTEAKRSEPSGQAAAPPPADPARPAARPAAAAATGPNRCPAEREVADVKRQARDEFDRLEKALGMSKDALAKERADSEKFRKQSM